MIKLKSYSARTDSGPYLQVNEDDHDIDLVNNLFLLFDGFGGTNIGDKAVELVKETVKKFYTKIGGDPDSTLPFYFSHKYLIEGNALINALHLAHSLLKKENSEKEMSNRGGASGICAALAENILTFASTGNCLCYRYRRGHIEVVVQPDSLRTISKDNYDPQFHSAPMSGFGLFDDLHLQISEYRVLPEDLFILMSDGVYSRVEPKEICYTIEKSLPQSEKIDELFNLANSRGNLDNQSTIFLQF
ncbi:MAG: protein phosphatase 2C domain-containing protein [Bacteriovoracaceae bacterium]|nr:protein phosphatase 2C domain-containing protein [Bacteriovoracaceae bacterium]